MSGCAGLLLSFHAELPAGPAVILSAGGVYALAGSATLESVRAGVRARVVLPDLHDVRGREGLLLLQHQRDHAEEDHLSWAKIEHTQELAR